MSQLLKFDLSGAYLPKAGLKQAAVASLGAPLEKLRDEVCQIDPRMLAGEIATPAEKQPLDAGFYAMPSQLLSEYEADRVGSHLARILAVTKQMMTEVDRVVVLGAGCQSLGGQAIMDACCQPYYNQLSRGQRGSRPRVYFAGDDLDNDALQGLLHLLAADRTVAATCVEDAWGLVVLSTGDEVMATHIAAQHFLAALRVNCGGDQDKLRRRCVPIVSGDTNLGSLLAALGCSGEFQVTQGVGTRYSVLSAAGLVPAALLGVNVMKLLEGARLMSSHFLDAKAAENVVLQFAAVNHANQTQDSAGLRILNVGNSGLETAGRWYAQLLEGSLGSHASRAWPLTVVGSRDLCLKRYLLGDDGSEAMVNNLIVEEARFDPLGVEVAALAGNAEDESMLQGIAEPSLLSVNLAVLERQRMRLRELGCPATDLYLPCVDELRMGQYFQMMMLATVMEARMLGVNPYA